MQEIGKVSEVSGKVKIEWQIENFFSYSQAGSSYESPEFSLSYLKFKVQINPNGTASQDTAGYVSLFLHRTDKYPSKVFEFEFGIKTVNGDTNYLCKTTWTSNSKGLGWLKFIQKSSLISEKLELVPSNTLTIICAICIKENILDIDLSTRKLSADLKDMFNLKRNCDILLEVKEELFQVHKIILAARSPVFAAMFETKMSEKETGIVNIPDCDPKVFRDFLLYVYSAELNFSKCKICDLYKIADKYDVSDLKLVCIDFMICSLSINNLSEYHILGCQFNETNLLTEAQTFFNKNFKKIACTSEWKSMLEKHTDLAFDLLKGMVEALEN